MHLLLSRLHKNSYKGNVWKFNDGLRILHFKLYRQQYQCSCPIDFRTNRGYSWLSNQSSGLQKNNARGYASIFTREDNLLRQNIHRRSWFSSQGNGLQRQNTSSHSWSSSQGNGLQRQNTSSHSWSSSQGNSLQRPNTRGYSWFSGQGNGLQNAINDAEKLVGYPTAYNSWKYLFDEEPATFIGLARKIVGSGHPLLQTARDILSQDPHSSNHLGGLWVLLISKAAGINPDIDVDSNFVQGIHQKQRILAETTELINTAFIIHRNMLDLSDESYSKDVNKKTLEFGNKLFVLGGDFLLSKASLELAKLENTDVVAMIGQSIGDMAEGITLEEVSDDVSGWTVSTWEDYIFLLRGSLMANSCKSSTTLMEHSDEACSHAYDFGENLVLAQHCGDDVESFLDKKQLVKRTNFVLITALQDNPELITFVKNSKDVWTNLILNRELKAWIHSMRPAIIEEVRNSCDRYIDNCVKKIALFPQLETVKAIETVLRSISER